MSDRACEAVRPIRRAVVVNGIARIDTIRRYLPSNYYAREGAGIDNRNVIIYGSDNAGWTLDGYVIPRLASGLIYAREV